MLQDLRHINDDDTLQIAAPDSTLEEGNTSANESAVYVQKAVEMMMMVAVVLVVVVVVVVVVVAAVAEREVRQMQMMSPRQRRLKRWPRGNVLNGKD